MQCQIAVQHIDHRHIFVVNFDLQVMHLDSLDARMKNENQNLLDTIKKNTLNDLSFFHFIRTSFRYSRQLKNNNFNLRIAIITEKIFRLS